ncbi:ABC transporter substrate-binding protein [Rhodopseudomonas sp. P2A-2r]|uniref:ABC transporter substrate-binding protein n=1 Tax=unclassified Rhodopseudomonas TaxID=2638247 RepID=UPI00223431F5|nr:ABC transporter substrate-binding protein [Rhodopseudomonas sp. P2A-2r]UZE51066.1 ABC transporter substrate-binding protein [Rhodopseudomonas sp. P2A-2r]
MDITRRTMLATGLAGIAMMPARLTQAQARDTIRIGVITDMSGVYSDVSGPTTVACAQQAAMEFMSENPGIKVEILVADHQNKPDVGLGIIRRWFDIGGIDVIENVGNSAIVLGSRGLLEEKDKASIITTAASSNITGKDCSAHWVHWSHDSWGTTHSTAVSTVKTGGRKWFFLTADYAYGHAAEADTGRFVTQAGGKVLGSVRFPLGATGDFSSYLLRAQSSGADVLGIIGGGSDLINIVKQASEFGLGASGMKLAVLSGYITEILGMGLPEAKGLLLTESFYWDLNERTRSFMTRLKPRVPNGVFPNMSQAGDYAGVMHYLKAVKAIGVPAAKASGRKTIETMKAMPTDDDCFGAGRIRQDGRKIHPNYLFTVKSPDESRYPGDVFKLTSTVPAEEAFRPLNDGGCALVKA